MRTDSSNTRDIHLSGNTEKYVTFYYVNFTNDDDLVHDVEWWMVIIERRADESVLLSSCLWSRLLTYCN